MLTGPAPTSPGPRAELAPSLAEREATLPRPPVSPTAIAPAPGAVVWPIPMPPIRPKPLPPRSERANSAPRPLPATPLLLLLALVLDPELMRLLPCRPVLNTLISPMPNGDVGRPAPEIL